MSSIEERPSADIPLVNLPTTITPSLVKVLETIKNETKSSQQVQGNWVWTFFFFCYLPIICFFVANHN